MKKIKSLFDPSRDIYRTIEKVITYNVSQEKRLKAEISEYQVTESIEEQFEKLLSKMQAAMESGGENDVGVWVSGFYGSGKSSFTKYLGLAFDEKVQINGIPFMQHLQNRLHKPQTKALLSTVAKRFPAAVVMLDLASEMLAGATMEDVSTVLYYKVLQWAGYSRNLKVAAFERKMQKDGRYKEFKQRILSDLEVEWASVQNDPLVVDSMIPEIAHQMYPELFKSPTAFSTETKDFVQFETERVKEMIDIVQETTNKKYIIFIIDEVGQYVGSRQNLIINLDGLSKNLKNIGEGKVWIVGTAQQTLTEDDPRATLNSPELYKLKDRFPIQIDLEASDIREICYRRLLGKSPEGESYLEDLFKNHGQGLRHSTKLQDAKYYDSDFNKETFVNLYPFLPAHFDVLLHLLGALAKSTGGIGLRSAIKVVQDILIEGSDIQKAVAENKVGWLATTVTLYDALEKDIRRAFPSIYRSVDKALTIRFPDSKIHKDISKTVAVLQILNNLPVTIHNVASLMHPGIEVPSQRDEVEKAVDELISDSIVPFGEQDGNLCFFSEKLNEIEQERAQLPLRTVETRRIFNEALKDSFSPLPSTRLHNSLAVTSGLKSQSGFLTASIAGERETIQTVIEFVDPGDYDTARTRLVDESRHRSSQYIVYLLGRTVPEIDEKIAEIYRCRDICQRYRNEPDQEVKEYCVAQADRAAKLTGELQHIIRQCLGRGSFIFRGQTIAVDILDQNVQEASKKHLATVANQVFDRYSEAQVRAETSLAEKFLRAGNLSAITTQIDPLGLVQIQSGTPSIRTDHKALLSIRDYIDRNGTVEGKRLIEHFTGAPFGWSQDTLRYLIAAMLVAGEIKLKVSGREVTVSGQQAIDALKTNNAFKPVGVALRDERSSMEVCAMAAQRLTELIGDVVTPLEQDISKAVTKNFPHLQLKLAPLEGKLINLDLPGIENIRSLNQDIADVLFTDASDAPQRLGGEESALYENLKWAGEVDVALKNGLESTVKALQGHKGLIQELPDSGVPGELRNELKEELEHLEERLGKEDFYKHGPDLNTTLTNLRARTRDAVIKMNESQKNSIKESEQDLRRIKEWKELTQEEQTSVLSQLEDFQIEPEEGIQGLKHLISQEFVIHSTIQDIRKRIVSMGADRAREKEKERREKAKRENVYLETISIPKRILSVKDLNNLLQALEKIRANALEHDKIELSFKLDITPE